MKRATFIIGTLLTVVLVSWAVVRRSAPHQPSGTVDAGCSRGYGLVCGTDGATYQNACWADRAGIQVAHEGACQTPSSLSADERAQLLWLLRARTDAGLPEVPVRHERTEQGPCDSCRTYYYVWGDPEVRARIMIRGSVVASAVDSTGYDYVAHTQGNPETIDARPPVL